MVLQALLPLLGTIGSQVAKSLFPSEADKAKRDEVANQFQLAVLEHSAKFEQAAADIVKTEAASKHWLAANWRPITALFFVGLIGARWFGFTAPGMSEAEYLSVYELIKIMIGGYVVSRGAEKMFPGVVDAFMKRKRKGDES